MLPSKRAVLYAIRVKRNTKQNQGCKNIYVVNTVRLEEIRMSDLQIEVYHEHRVPRHIWGHGFVKVGDTDLKRRFRVSWCEIINYNIITII